MDTVDEYKAKEFLKAVNELAPGKKIDEGLFGSVVGGIIGNLTGPKVGDAICKALGITKGTLYDLFHSRAFLTILGGYLGYKW